MKLSGLTVIAAAVFSVMLFGCNSKGACVMRSDDTSCVEVSKSVCDEGKDTWLGDTCKKNGFTVQSGSGWDKPAKKK